MPDYRAYLVDEDDSFCDVVKMDCVDDVEATEKTRPLAGKYAVELWQLDRTFPRQKKSP
jgi:hypothetical protein